MAWVKAVMAHRGWTQTELARRAGVDPSTLSRFFREATPGAALQARTIERIEAVGGIPAFQVQPPPEQRGFQENEAEPYSGQDADDLIRRSIAAAKDGRNGLDMWVLKSRALESAGYLPGDLLMVDLNQSPRDGDAICAQIHDQAGKTETIMRIYEEPYLVAASSDPKLMRPLHLGRDQVMVRGVVVASFRPRRAA